MEVSIEDMLGETFTKITKDKKDGSLKFYTKNGIRYKMYHERDCCETVWLDDINGDLDDLIGSPIVKAESPSSKDWRAKDEYDESFTWTFYHLATIKGYVVLRWYGTSTGYYSESVQIIKYVKENALIKKEFP